FRREEHIRRLGEYLQREPGLAMDDEAALRRREISRVALVKTPIAKKPLFVPGQFPPHTLTDLFFGARDGPDTEFIHLTMAFLIPIRETCSKPMWSHPKLIDIRNGTICPS